MIKLYSSHCPRCIVIKNLMEQKGMRFAEVDSSDIYLKVADENNITSMPFAEINGKIYNTKELQNYINNINGGK